MKKKIDIKKIIENNIFKDMIEKSYAESVMWRVKYKMNPQTGFPVKNRQHMEELLKEQNLNYSKEFLDKVFEEPVDNIQEVPEEKSPRGRKSKGQATRFELTGNYKQDIKAIKEIIIKETNREWNSGRLKIEFVPTKIRTGGQGVKAICSNGQTLVNIGNIFNTGSLIKWIKENGR